MSLLKTNEIQNYNGSSLTLTASTVSTSAQLNTGGNISVTGSLNVSDDSTTRTNLGLGTIATQDSDSVNLTGGTIGSGVVFPAGSIVGWEQVTTVPVTPQGTDTSYTDVTGSSKNYTPATNSNYVVYEYSTTIQGNSGSSTFLPIFKLIYDGSEVANTNHGFFVTGSSSSQGIGYYTMRFILSSWSGSKNVKLQYRIYSSSYEFLMHKATYSGEGTTTDVFTNIYQVTYSVM